MVRTEYTCRSGPDGTGRCLKEDTTERETACDSGIDNGDGDSVAGDGGKDWLRRHWRLRDATMGFGRAWCWLGLRITVTAEAGGGSV